MAPQIDFTTHDVLLTITGDKRKGLWVNSSFSKASKKAIRSGGQLPTQASLHTLLLVALVNALRAFTKNQYEMLAKQLPPGVTKPRVKVVVVGDGNFADALTGSIAHNSNAPRLKAGRNFHTVAAQVLSRFTLDMSNSRDGRDRILNDWARKNMYPIRSIVEPALAAKIVSQTVLSDY
jgi:hypothetical protein